MARGILRSPETLPQPSRSLKLYAIFARGPSGVGEPLPVPSVLERFGVNKFEWPMDQYLTSDAALRQFIDKLLDYGVMVLDVEGHVVTWTNGATLP